MYIVQFLNVFIEFFLAAFYFNIIFKQKELKKLFKWLFLLVCICICCFASTLPLPGYSNLAISSVVYFFILLILYEGNILKKIYSFFTYLVILFVSDTLTAILLTYIFSMNYDVVTSDHVTRVLGMMMTDFIVLCLANYASKIFNQKETSLPLKYWLFIILCPIFSIILVVMMDILLIQLHTTNLILIIIPVIGLLYLNFAVFNIFETYSNQLKLKIMEELAIQNEENYKILESTEQEMKILRHDIGNHVAVMKNLLEKNDVNTATEYLMKIENTVSAISSVVYTKNQALDSVLNIEGRKAAVANIKYLIKINAPEEIKLDPVDICTIFTNAIDNAIEACSTVAHKYIIVKIDSSTEKLKISIENSSESVTILYGNMMKTTKSDTSKHGFGLKSMKEAVKKYDGVINTEYENGVFTLDIFMNNG